MNLSRDEEPFVAAVRDNPRGYHRLVYADWLEENGSTERADYLRVSQRLASRAATPAERRELFLVVSAFDPGWTSSRYWSAVLGDLRPDLHAAFLEAMAEFVTLPVEFRVDQLPSSLKLLRDLREMRPFMANLFRFLGRRFPEETFDIELAVEQPAMSEWRETVGVHSSLRIVAFQPPIRVPIMKAVVDAMQVDHAGAPALADRLPIVFPDLLRETIEFQLQRLDDRIPPHLRRHGLSPDATRPLYEIDLSH